MKNRDLCFELACVDRRCILSNGNYKIFNDAYNVDYMLQIEEATGLGIEGDIKPEIVHIN
jgi:hypothetical protein